jgi:hypothetical protein
MPYPSAYGADTLLKIGNDMPPESDRSAPKMAVSKWEARAGP